MMQYKYVYTAAVWVHISTLCILRNQFRMQYM